jgi:hypothetical protein
LIRLAGRIRLVIEMFPYSTVVLADNENFHLTVCVTTTSPLIEAHDAVRREGGTCEPARAGGPGPSDPSPAPTMVGATKLIAMAIGIRAMTKWKAESYSVVAHNADPYLELTQGRCSPSCSGAVRYVCSITSKALASHLPTTPMI